MLARKFFAFVFVCLVSATLLAAPPVLNTSHPDKYVVVKGDTLWDISARFLRDPWRWPDVWQANPQVKNPHLIYPGDVISLSYDANGKPVLRIQRGRQTVKLSPGIRATKLDRAIPTIPLDAIRQFLSRPLVLTQKEIDAAAYVVASAGEHVVAGAGDRVYVRGIKGDTQSKFSLFQPGKPYRNPGADKDDILGIEAIYVGEGTAQAFGDPTTLLLTSTEREARSGDRVMPFDENEISEHFMPHAPRTKVEGGAIIGVVDGVSQIGQHQIVVLNKGTQDKMDIGTVLAVYRSGETIHDLVTTENRDDTVTLPDERAGTLMVFRSFDRVSYALVMEATRAMHIYDAVRNPPEL
ncbi:LysM peptidoglycan-binding domain-containing protein [Sulfuriflexus mobilis]|uniref:LysM peptidoglycan-binding domain-containing protein n=1 Tax=Sulfuriflexus mobilis TaxID=1811807 RepID=UPI000F8358CF|nr:LysM peptidoglycan-binding domain-containing protein [Sulfuriflexus mobilis]